MPQVVGEEAFAEAGQALAGLERQGLGLVRLAL